MMAAESSVEASSTNQKEIFVFGYSKSAIEFNNFGRFTASFRKGIIIENSVKLVEAVRFVMGNFQNPYTKQRIKSK